MKVSKIYIAVIFIVLLLTAGYFFIYRETFLGNDSSTLKDISQFSDEDIVALLKTNPDSSEYMGKYKDFKIGKRTVLTKESILEGQNGENFKEVYQGLDIENNRYLRADLMNSAGDWGLITILDFKKRTVAKVFGMLLISTGVEVK